MKEGTKYPICKKFKGDTSSVGSLGALTQATAFLVVFIGFVLRTLYINLITCVKEHKTSKQANATMISILIVTFFNTGLVYFIASSDFSELSGGDSGFFRGVYTDVTSQWFVDIGNLIAETTAINIVSPLVEFLFFWSIRHIKRIIDQKAICPCDNRNTRAKTIQAFESLYSGPVFFVHYRLAYIINIVFIAFLYGPGMPVLFLIALAGLIQNYISERLRMAYSYTKPPMYDSRLSQNTLRALSYAPFLYAISAAWLFSNQ